MTMSGPPSSKSSRGNTAKNKLVIPRAEILVRNAQVHSKSVKVFSENNAFQQKGKSPRVWI